MNKDRCVHQRLAQLQLYWRTWNKKLSIPLMSMKDVLGMSRR